MCGLLLFAVVCFKKGSGETEWETTDSTNTDKYGVPIRGRPVFSEQASGDCCDQVQRILHAVHFWAMEVVTPKKSVHYGEWGLVSREGCARSLVNTQRAGG